MKFTELSDQEILEIVTPLVVDTENAWNNKNYKMFCQHLLIDPEHEFTSENFYAQIEKKHTRLGAHTVKDCIALHRNPDNIVVMWEVGIECRDEPGVIIYKFTEQKNKIVITGCTFHD